MITTVITNRTFEKVAAGERVIYFRHKPHWDARFSRSLHNSIILLSGQRSQGFRIVRVEDTGGSYAVHLGEEIKAVKQEPLFSACHSRKGGNLSEGFRASGNDRIKNLFVPGAVLV